MKNLNPLAKPSKMDINSDSCNIQHLVVSTLEQKYSGHEFAVFGGKLYVDDRGIDFPYTDANMQEATEILSAIEKKVSKLI